jgi:predicted nucleic acid-binding protein
MDLHQAIRQALETGTPNLYLDTNVLLDILRPQRRPTSAELLGLLQARGWKCTSSYFALMEALDIEQENAWARQKVRAGQDFEWIVRRRRDRDLRPQALTLISNRFIRRFVDELENAIFWAVLDAEVWEQAATLAASSNISAADCLHVATAVAHSCHVLVTSDGALISVASDYIASGTPEDVLQLVQTAVF